jgi:hypothetical protein
LWLGCGACYCCRQVHVATAHDGTKLAVKVQHAGLRESCVADTTTIEFLVKAVRVVFPDFNYMWLVRPCSTCMCCAALHAFMHFVRNFGCSCFMRSSCHACRL